MKNVLKKMKSKLNIVKTKLKKSADVIATPFKKLAQTKGMQAVIKVIKIPFIGYLLLACILNLILEMLSRHSIVKVFAFIAESPTVYLYNVFIIFLTLSLVLFAKRRVFATVFVCAVWIISAFANYIVLSFRTTPFSAIDVLMLRNVMTMLDKYLTKWQMVLSVIGIVLVILLLVYLYVRLPKSKSRRHPFRASAYVCMCAVLVATLTKVAVETHTISDNFGNLAYAYNDYGFAYCFSNSIIDVGISEPKEYSEEAIRTIVKDLEYDKSEVVLMTEAEALALEETAKDAAETVSDDSTAMEGSTGKEEVIGVENLTGTDNLTDIESLTDTENSDDDEMEKSEPTDATGEDVDKTVNEVETSTEDTEENLAEEERNEELTEELKNETSEASLDETDATEIASADKENLTENASGIVEETTNTEAEDEPVYFSNEPATEEYPNIIIIQLESVFDVKYMKDFYTSEDPTPTLTRLKDNYSHGLFTVPAVGAGTANTEFEVQTGISTSFFGAGEYPFKTVMTDMTCGSMGYDLKRQGYATAGFHNNDATFYERYVDYSHLGFDTFSGMEHMYMLNYTPRGWAKDDVLDDAMIERMKQTEGRDYITTITVQGHGRYPKKYTHTLTDLTCNFGGKYAGDTEKRAAWKYYINMCRETDNMVASLLYKLKQVDEPTVVFMYGDHLPSLSLEEDDLDGITLYETEWVMWDNMGLKYEEKDMTSYQASTYIFNRLNLKGGLIQSFHNKYMNMEDQKRYLEMLEMLAYDTLYGEHYAYDGVNPFPQTDMVMGLRDIVVSGYDIQDDTVLIYGDAFNEFSEVHIDGKSVDTKYINYQTLSVSLKDFEDGEELYVAQAGEDHVVLSVTDTISINEEDEIEDTSEDSTEESTTEE